MIRRLYIHNFRCLENFELNLSDLSSVLLIGNNGSGKSTIGRTLEILQRIGRGANRVGELVKGKDLSYGRTEAPMRMEIEVKVDNIEYVYSIVFDLPKTFRELRVKEERLSAAGETIFSRELSKVRVVKGGRDATFSVDWHLIALPIIHDDASAALMHWLSRMLVLRPIPALIDGESVVESLEPNAEVTNLGAWIAGLLASTPAAYATIDRYLKDLMHDLKDLKNPPTGTDSRRLEVRFSNNSEEITLPFSDLSDGEKCFLICAVVLASNDAYGPIFCFWDEPDNYLALAEVGQFVMALRRAFRSGGQLVATSHNPEVIRQFSNENTLYVYRKGHLEPTQIRPVSELTIEGDLVGALTRGDIEP